MTSYFQYHHLISINRVTNAIMLIAQNTFQNLSMAGSLIYFEEDEDQFGTAIAIHKNQFYLIHGYSGPVIM